VVEAYTLKTEKAKLLTEQQTALICQG